MTTTRLPTFLGASLLFAACGDPSHFAPLAPGAGPPPSDGEPAASATPEDPGRTNNWSAILGGAGDDAVSAVVAAPDGSTYVAGVYADIDSGALDSYIMRLDSRGQPLWGRAVGGTGDDVIHRIALGPDGPVVVGSFHGTIDLAPALGSGSRVAENADAFVIAFDPDGGARWVGAWGGPGDDAALDVAVGLDGSVAVTGTFSERADLDPGAGEDRREAAGLVDAVAMLFGRDGRARWVRTWGGPGTDMGTGVAVAADGSIAVTGRYDEGADLNPGVGGDWRGTRGAGDAFVMVLDAEGRRTGLQIAGGPGDDTGIDVAAAPGGGFLVVGDFAGTMSIGARTLEAAGGSDVFVAALAPDASVRWVRRLGSSGDDQSGSIAAASGGRALVSLSRSAGGPRRAEAALLGDDSALDAHVLFAGEGPSWGLGTDLAADGRVILGGSFQGTMVVPTGSGVSRGFDGFVTTAAPVAGAAR